MSTAIPTKRQLEYQDWEFGIFLHFGIRTFYEGHLDWDKKPMEAAGFKPTSLDCNSWAATARAAGARYIVLTAKHHDGFANWPSQYTDFSVAGSPWRDGKGDVIAEFVAACRRNDLKIGLYYSPADASSSAFDKGDAKAYDDYFIGQIGEILSGYGQIDILWFDGCHSEGHRYDFPRIFGEIRRMQPDILIFNMGDPDFRWVGNEAGVAPIPCFNTISADDFGVLAEGTPEMNTGQPRWLPAECDCRMRGTNWFYSDHDEHTVKSVDELMGLYYLSAGRGCNLLINIGPDRRGLLPDADAARLLEFGAEVKRRFANPVATLQTAELDDQVVAWKFPEGGHLVDHVVLQEDLTSGEHVRRFRVEAGVSAHGQPVVLWEGANIGHRAICRFPAVWCNALTVRILEADGKWTLRTASLFYCGASTQDRPAQEGRRIAPRNVRREETEWQDLCIVDSVGTSLPRVLLIGDSITIGYRPEVARLLEGIASVSRLSTSKSLGDYALLDETENALREHRWDVIHFNNGLHGRDYTEGQYGEAFPAWLAILRRAAPDADLIWASTTAVRDRADLETFDAFNERVVKRNAIAAAVAGAHRLLTNDLNALSVANPGHYSPDGVHMNAEGAKAQARQIADCLVKCLRARSQTAAKGEPYPL